MIRAASISECERFRFTLTRIWDPLLPILVFVMLNPSTADGKSDDRTVAKCIAFARRLGFGGILIVNLYPFRTKDPKELAAYNYPTTPANIRALQTAFTTAAQNGGKVVCAWGANARGHAAAQQCLDLIRGCGATPYALRILADGTPSHPLYLPNDSELLELA